MRLTETMLLEHANFTPFSRCGTQLMIRYSVYWCSYRFTSEHNISNQVGSDCPSKGGYGPGTYQQHPAPPHQKAEQVKLSAEEAVSSFWI